MLLPGLTILPHRPSTLFQKTHARQKAGFFLLLTGSPKNL